MENNILSSFDKTVSKDRLTAIVSILFVVHSIFYVFVVASFFKLATYPLHNRISFVVIFEDYLIGKQADYLVLILTFLALVVISQKSPSRRILFSGLGCLVLVLSFFNQEFMEYLALLSMPVILALILLKILNRVNFVSLRLVPFFYGVAGIVFAVDILALTIAKIFSQTVPLRNFGYEWFTIISSYSPIYTILLMACFPIKAIMNPLTKLFKTRDRSYVEPSRLSNKFLILMLIMIGLFSIFLAFIPHLESINPDGQQVSVDTGFYVNWINATRNTENTEQLLYQSFVIQSDGDRPISLILLMGISKFFNDDLTTTIEYSGIILGPALMISIFYLTRELTENDKAALLAAFLTTVSFQMLIGIYAGFYSNLIALIFGFFSFVFLLRFLKDSQRKDAVIFFGLTVLLFLSHVYTWAVLSIFCGVYLAVLLKTKNYPRKRVLILLGILMLVVGADLVKMNLTDSVSGIGKDVEKAEYLSGSEQFVKRWENLEFTSQIFGAGQFSNFLVLGLVFYWLWASDWKKNQNLFIMIFLSVGIFAVLFGKWPLQARVLFDIPFQIPAAMALSGLFFDRKNWIILAAVLVFLSSLAIRSLSNYYFINPS